MKRDVTRFLCKLLLFLLPLLTLFGYAEVRLRQVPNGYRDKRTSLERQLDSVEILVLGSSHAYYGVDPNCLSLRAFNLAYVFQSPYYDTRLVRTYLDRMPRLRLVLVDVNYISLWYQLANTKESWRDYFYYHFWGIRYRNLARFDPMMVSYVALYTWKATLGYARRNFSVNPSCDPLPNGLAPACCPNGFGNDPSDTTPRPDLVRDTWGKTRVQCLDSMIEASHLSENVADLDTMLEELGRRNVRVVFVTLPEYDCFSRHLNPAINRRTAQIIDSFCLTYGCRRADYRSDSRFVASDFRDGDHLNFRGAQKFSRILNRDCIAGSAEPRGEEQGNRMRNTPSPQPSSASTRRRPSVRQMQSHAHH
jgi:hypothetical protein